MQDPIVMHDNYGLRMQCIGSEFLSAVPTISSRLTAVGRTKCDIETSLSPSTNPSSTERLLAVSPDWQSQCRHDRQSEMNLNKVLAQCRDQNPTTLGQVLHGSGGLYYPTCLNETVIIRDRSKLLKARSEKRFGESVVYYESLEILEEWQRLCPKTQGLSWWKEGCRSRFILFRHRKMVLGDGSVIFGDVIAVPLTWISVAIPAKNGTRRRMVPELMASLILPNNDCAIRTLRVVFSQDAEVPEDNGASTSEHAHSVRLQVNAKKTVRDILSLCTATDFERKCMSTRHLSLVLFNSPDNKPAILPSTQTISSLMDHVPHSTLHVLPHALPPFLPQLERRWHAAFLLPLANRRYHDYLLPIEHDRLLTLAEAWLLANDPETLERLRRGQVLTTQVMAKLQRSLPLEAGRRGDCSSRLFKDLQQRWLHRPSMCPRSTRDRAAQFLRTLYREIPMVRTIMFHVQAVAFRRTFPFVFCLGPFGEAHLCKVPSWGRYVDVMPPGSWVVSAVLLPDLHGREQRLVQLSVARPDVCGTEDVVLDCGSAETAWVLIKRVLFATSGQSNES